MPFAIRLLAATPVWAYLVLGYLVWQGIQSLRPRTLPLWRVLIVPTLFIAAGASRIVVHRSAGLGALAPWAVGLILSAPIAFVTGPRLLSVNRATSEVTRPGSPVPLIRNLLVFTLQYAVAVMSTARIGSHAQVDLVAPLISGCTAGYFIGWVIVALQHYRSAPSKPARLVLGKD